MCLTGHVVVVVVAAAAAAAAAAALSSLPVRWKDDDAADAIALGAVRAPACDIGGQYCS